MIWPNRHAGFTLIELVVVITLLGVFAGALGLIVVQPFTADRDMRQRARLTDQADLIIDRIRREVRTALPNSVRVDSGNSAAEFVPTFTGGRYRRLPDPTVAGSSGVLDRTGPQDQFDVLGRLPDIDQITTGDAGVDDCAFGTTSCMNIFNTGQDNFKIYENDNIAEIIAVSNNAGFGNDQLTYDNGGANTPAFRSHSPNQRFVLFDTVVSFVCDGNRLERFEAYGLMSSQPVTDGDFGVGSQLVADDLTQCEFRYDPGAATRQGLLKIDIRIQRGGEAVDLFAQVHVVNAP